MGRGDGNILYNPVKISKGLPIPNKSFFPSEEQFFSGTVRELVLGDKGRMILQEDEAGAISLEIYDGKRYPLGDEIEPGVAEVLKKGVSRLTDEGLLWLEGNTVFLKVPREKTERYPYFLDGHVLDIAADKDYIYLLWRSDEEAKTHLAAIRRSDNDLQHLFSYAGEIELRDQILLLKGDGGERQIATLKNGSLGTVHHLDAMLATSIAVDDQRIEKAMVAPGDRQGEYFFYLIPSAHLAYINLALGGSKAIIPHQNNAKSINELWTDGDYLALEKSGHYLALLEKGKLTLATKEGVLDTLQLERNYSEMVFSGDTIFLFDKGDNRFLKVRLV